MSDIKLTPEQEKVFSASDWVTDGDGEYFFSDWDEVQEWMHNNDVKEMTLYPSKDRPFKLLAKDVLLHLDDDWIDETPTETILKYILERKSGVYLGDCEYDYYDETLWSQSAEDKLFRDFTVFMALNRWRLVLGFKPWCLWILDRAIAKFNKTVEESDCFAMLWPDESMKCVVKYEDQHDV